MLNEKLLVVILFLAFTLVFSSCNACNSKNQTAGGPVNVQADLFAGHENDAVRFAEIYPVSRENPFIIAGFEELAAYLKWGTGIIAFGFPDCPRCRNAFPVLEKAFAKKNMGRHAGFRGKILYYDFYDDREENNERYQVIVNYIKDFLPVDKNGNPRLYSPDIFFIAFGKIVGNHLDTVPSLTDPYDSLNDEQEAELLKIYIDLIDKVEDCGC
jgi:thiol-disulfide isomerase/thioredoxin